MPHSKPVYSESSRKKLAYVISAIGRLLEPHDSPKRSVGNKRSPMLVWNASCEHKLSISRSFGEYDFHFGKLFKLKYW